MGRPSKLTPEVQKKLCSAVGAGNYYEAACAYAGVSYAVFRFWMRKGQKARRGRYFKFFKAVRLAEAEAEVTIVAQWRQQIPESHQAARDFLERRFPKRWGRKDRTELTGKDGRPLQLEANAIVEVIVTSRQQAADLLPSLNGASGLPGRNGVH